VTYVSAGQVTVEFPFSVATGSANVVVTTPGGSSTQFSVTVAATRNQQYRETGRFADDLGAVIARTEFLLRDIMTGLMYGTL